MLQFDYALGFFKTLAKTALKWIDEELTNGKFHTRWLFHHKTPIANKMKYSSSFMDRYNAECIINNYLTVVAGIFEEISRLTADIENWNIEFEDVGKRIDSLNEFNNEFKAERLLFLDGVYRADSELSLLMREIMLYKA